MRVFWALIAVILCASSSVAARPQVLLVHTEADYKSAMKSVRPGDTIALADKVWMDFQIVFQSQGTPSKPITLTAQTPGKVILSGRSNLRLAGQYLHVRGLVFRNGVAPNGEVISFRRSKTELAFHSRVSETVIEQYSNPDRAASDYWVAMYGQHNRFDHNHLFGKRNTGVTMAVILDSKQSRQNFHRIDHNYFGPRPVLGANGGETLRIGTSEYSMFDSNTLVENNFFEGCNGEVEIISSKSGANIYRGNVFFASQGSITLRHGDGNQVLDNIFFGMGVANTGGIRVINRNQVVRNNYLEGLRGTGFASALTVMNGVPNSPVNRYVQVANADISNNTVVDSTRISLAAGSDAERSAPPVTSKMQSNLFVSTQQRALLQAEDDISGITFSQNVVDEAKGTLKEKGMQRQSVAMVRAPNGLLYPTDTRIQAGVSRSLQVTQRAETGVAWYPKPAIETPTETTSERISLAPGADLVAAIKAAPTGAIITLQAGDYAVDEVLNVERDLSLVGPNDQSATLSTNQSTLFALHDRVSLRLNKLSMSGAGAPDALGNALIRSVGQPGASGLRIVLEQVRVENLSVNGGFDVIVLSRGSMAEKVRIQDSVFQSISGAVLRADEESDDYGRYNVERVDISRSQFRDIGGAVATIYRGGTDESTFGPRFEMDHCVLKNVGNSARNSSKAAIKLHGVQFALIQNNAMDRSAPVLIRHTVGKPRTTVRDNRFTATLAPKVEELNYRGEARAVLSENIVDVQGMDEPAVAEPAAENQGLQNEAKR